MIVDCYTHAWDATTKLGRGQPAFGSIQRDAEPADLRSGFTHHLAAAEPVDFTIIAGFKSRYLEAEISNETVSKYVLAHRDRMIGFAGVDPSTPDQAIEDMKYARGSLSMKGVAVAPAAQDFHPTNSQAMIVYAEAAKLGLPILFHAGLGLCPATKLEYARPLLLDEVARELPNLKILIAHMGYPWIEETILLLAKHPHVFAETSDLFHQPWQAYHALLSAHQAGVIDKLMFGSGFPLATAAHCIEELYSINHLCPGTNLPTIPREQLRRIVERDALALLGITPSAEQAPFPVSVAAPESDLDEL